MDKMTLSWRTLKLGSNEPQTPPLLVKYEFGLLHYNIYLSDLTYIWMESLERRQIVKRALNVDTSIDPSESGDQLQLLLQNIQKALDEVEGATLSLSKSGISQQLILRTTTPLPGALKPLVWPIHLMPAPQHLLTAELLQPCLNQQFFAKAQVASLIQLLKEKDHVITRLTEKMQSDGTDMSKIFPGASGLRSGAKLHFREAASKFVKGLGEFDDEQWRKGFFDSTQLPSNLPDVFTQVFSSDLGKSTDYVIKDTGGTWWQNLRNEDLQKSTRLNSFVSNTFERTQPTVHSSTGFENCGANDAGFQQRRVSAHISKGAQNQIAPPITYSTDAPSNGDTTTDDSDGDLISSILNDHAIKKSVQPSPDTLSRSNSAVEAEFGTFKAENSKKHKPKPDVPVGGSEKPDQANPDEENEAMRVTSPESESIDNIPVPQSKPRLGKIGGRGKPIKASDPNKRNDIAFEPKSIPSRDGRKPTTMGTEDKARFTLPTDPDTLRKGRAGIRQESPSPQRETSQERVNNRRERLKRDLETTAMTRARKKRKF